VALLMEVKEEPDDGRLVGAGLQYGAGRIRGDGRYLKGAEGV
jgi:hypothetical protein